MKLSSIHFKSLPLIFISGAMPLLFAFALPSLPEVSAKVKVKRNT